MKVPEEIGTKHQKRPRQAKGGQTRRVIAKFPVLEISKRGGQRRGGEGAEEVLLINPLDKQPAPNTSCLADEAGTSSPFSLPPSSGKPIQQRARGNSGLKGASLSILRANQAGRNEIDGRGGL